MSQARNIALNLIDSHHCTSVKSITTKRTQKTARAIETRRFLFDTNYFAKVNSPSWTHDREKSARMRIDNSKNITELI